MPLATEEEIPLDEETLKSLSDETLRRSLVLSDKLYVELSLAKDFFIGTLLTFITHPKEIGIPFSDPEKAYGYLLSNLFEYRKRTFNDTQHYFPKLGLSNKDILLRMSDPTYADLIFRYAPITDFVKLLSSQISVNVNNSAVVSKKDKITIVVNTYPLKLSDDYKHIAGLYFASSFSCEIEIVYIEPSKMVSAYLLQFDEVYTYYIKEIFEIKEINDAFTHMKFFEKKIFVPKFLAGDITKVDTDREFKLIQAYMDLLATFRYIELAFVTASLPNQDDVNKAALEEVESGKRKTN